MNIYPWQQSQWAFLMRAYQQRRLSHAYLFYGRAGLGKVELAQAFSTFLLCEDKNKKNSACGKCCGCHWMRAKTHPDFFPVFPHEKGNTIKIDDIRLVIQKSTRT